MYQVCKYAFIYCTSLNKIELNYLFFVAVKWIGVGAGRESVIVL